MYVKEKCIFIHAYLKLRQARQKQVWKSRRVALNAMQHQTQRGHKKKCPIHDLYDYFLSAVRLFIA